MAKFVFTLDRVLRLRKQQERMAEVEVVRARAVVDAARLRVKEHQDLLQIVSDGLAANVGQTATAAQWSSAVEYSQRLGLVIRDAERQVREALEAQHVADRKRAEIAAEVEALQTLRNEQKAQYAQELQKAEQERTDEAGLRLWLAASDKRE